MDPIVEFEKHVAEVDPKYEVPQLSPVKGREGYGWIDFTGLPNTRDLGGLPGADGRPIKRGLLLRSGALGFGSDADIARLRDEYRLSLVVDLRNDEELAEVPDPMGDFPGARYVRANILTEQTFGITQEQAMQDLAKVKAVAEDVDPSKFMVMLYPRLLLSEPGIAGYRTFFQALLACEEGAALWHCSVGRDRCGMASVLIETALGVSRENIESDYLATNVYAGARSNAMGAASLVSLSAATEAVEREFGGYEAYIRDVLGIDDGAIAELRARYLE